MINPGIGSLLIPTARRRHQQAIEQMLKQANAVDPASAIKFEPEGWMQKRLLGQAVARGAVVSTSGGRYYLNERAWAEWRQSARFTALVIAVAIASLVASIAALSNTVGR